MNSPVEIGSDMINSLRQLDDILRGETTKQSSLAEGQLEWPVGGLTLLIVVLGAFSGLCTGSFALFRALWTDVGTTHGGLMQLAASAAKLPLLFFLTLLVTFPSLYVFSALAGSQLTIASVWRLVLAMLGVMLAVFASLGPIVVFFGASSESYAFMKLLNVVAAAAAGILGMTFLLRTLHRLIAAHEPETTSAIAAEQPDSQDADEHSPNADDHGRSPNDNPGSARDFVDTKTPSESLGALDRTGPTSDRARAVFQMWVVVFAVVGAQMSWVLRPFIGSPGSEFSWFRERKSNFFINVLNSLTDLLGG